MPDREDLIEHIVYDRSRAKRKARSHLSGWQARRKVAGLTIFARPLLPLDRKSGREHRGFLPPSRSTSLYGRLAQILDYPFSCLGNRQKEL